MAKRRRERDRPKAGPDSNYNPHKRLHLSYGDDDEDELEEDATALEQPPPINYPAVTSVAATTSSAQSSAAPDEETDYEPTPAYSDPPHKADKSSDTRQKPNANPGKNETTNQKPALGSLSYQWEGQDEDSEYASEEDEAMAYLRAVRSERQGMPAVLRAEDTGDEDIYSLGDSRGYIVEDCYIARPVLRPEPPKQKTVTAQEAYTEVLKRRFEMMRQRFREPRHLAAPHTQSDSAKSVPRPNDSRKAYDECVELVQNSSPSPIQLQAMDQEDTLAMLELIQKHYFKRGETLAKHTSTWIWALLARLDDVGTMNNDEVFVLRDLGKRALVIQISFNDAAMAAQLEDISRAEAASENEDSTLPQSKGQQEANRSKTDTAGSTVIQKLDPESTLATLDMIITIVGEFFGQRDLLDSRRSWDPEV